MYTYFHLLFLFLSKLIAQRIKIKAKLGSTLLGVSPVESPFLSRHFSEVKAIWLALIH